MAQRAAVLRFAADALDTRKAQVSRVVTQLETELGVPSYGSKYRMDLSLMPDVRTVVQVEE